MSKDVKQVKRYTGPTHPDEWEVTAHAIINGRHVTPGQPLTIARHGHKLPGTYHFIHHVRTPTTEWIECYGGKPGYELTRSFYPSEVRTVHHLKGTP
jgi:hypothetical protein